MSVAAINVRTLEGRTVHIMNYHDGHVGSTGAMLVVFYNNFDKAKELVKCGDLYALEQKLPSKEFIQTVADEVSRGDISKVPASPYNIYDGEDLKKVIKEHKCISSMNDYVACRFDLECMTLPLFDIKDNNGRKQLSMSAYNDTTHKTKKGFGAGEYTYLFDQKQEKWFVTDEVGDILCAVEDELRNFDRSWTPSEYMEKRTRYRRGLMNILKQLQNEYAKQNNAGNLNRRINNKTVQSEVKVSHKPQSVRELNDWLRRMNVASKFRVRTMKDRTGRYLAVQEFNRQGKWRAIGKCGVTEYNTVIYYLTQFVPIDWPNN